MPRLWNDTIDAHRNAVREATLDTTAALVSERGLGSVTMSEVASRTGIGRATLYKYFPDVGAILTAWHKRQIAHHFEQLVAISQRAGSAFEGLESVLEAYGAIAQRHRGEPLENLLHRGEHVTLAHQQLSVLICELVADAAVTGEVRNDVPPIELATYCLNALTAASSLSSKAALRRLVAVTLTGLKPQA